MKAMPDNDVERPAVGLPRALDLLRTNTFTGRDPDNLVTASVDGDGTVGRITFAATVTGRRPQAVAAAVLAAIADAQRRSVVATLELASARDESTPSDATTPDGIVGGVLDDETGVPA